MTALSRWWWLVVVVALIIALLFTLFALRSADLRAIQVQIDELARQIARGEAERQQVALEQARRTERLKRIEGELERLRRQR
jgi:low affinity Fe/Cu permease